MFLSFCKFQPILQSFVAFELDDEHQLFWLEHDGYRTGFINSVQGVPEQVLSKQEVLVQTAATPGHTWMALDYDATHRQLLLSDQRDRYLKYIFKNKIISE